MADESKHKPLDNKFDSVFARYNYWNGNPSGKPIYNNTPCVGCQGDSCHGDGGCGRDGD